jgi:uncharacterized protein YceH (UPF0502 family)
MCEFDDIAEVDVELEHLSGLPEPVVARLARRPGQKEERWVQLLTDSPTGILGPPADDVPCGGETPALAADVAELRVEVAELRDKVAKLCDDLETVRRASGQSPERTGT